MSQPYRNGPEVKIFDLRKGISGTFLDSLTPDDHELLGGATRAVVLDQANAMIDNYGHYQKLSQVARIICVAVEIAGVPHAPVLNQPAAVNSDNSAVTLWIGDESGVRWTAGSQRGRPVVEQESTLDQLLEALSDRRVFDEVIACVLQMPHHTACPALELVHARVEPEVVRRARIHVLRSMATHTDGAAGQLEAGFAQASPGKGAVLTGSRLDRERQLATASVKRAVDAVDQMRRWQAILVPSDLGADVWAAATDAGKSLGQYQDSVRQALRHMDNDLRSGRETGASATPFGVPRPEDVDHQRLATELRESMSAELRAEQPLAALAGTLRTLAAQREPQGTTDQLARLEVANVDKVVDGLSSPPEFPAWPVPWQALPAVLLVTLAATAMPTVGSVLGPLLALVFLLVCWQMLACRPRPSGRAVAHSAWPAVLGYVLTGAAATATAWWLPGIVDPPGTVEAVIAVLAALALAGILLASWKTAVLRWGHKARVDAAADAVGRLTELLTEAVAVEWCSAHHRRRTSDALVLLASGLDTVRQTYAELATVYGELNRDSSGAGRLTDSAELLAVARSDLVALTSEALRSCWAAIAAGSPLDVESLRLRESVREAVESYNDHVDRWGIHVMPPFVTDRGPRERLTGELWRSAHGAPRILHGDKRLEMTQLCRLSDLTLLNYTPSDIRVLHFAPPEVRHVLAPETSASVIWTETARVIGMIRLVPMRPGRIEQIWLSEPNGNRPPAAADETQNDGGR
jgi:hypothetical protein